jgi:hypothetical protein
VISALPLETDSGSAAGLWQRVQQQMQMQQQLLLKFAAAAAAEVCSRTLTDRPQEGTGTALG